MQASIFKEFKINEVYCSISHLWLHSSGNAKNLYERIKKMKVKG